MRNLILVLSGALLVGCAPKYTLAPLPEPKPATPASFDASAAEQAAAAPAPGAGHQTWKQYFSDPGLDALIDSALTNNQELNARLQEIVITQAEVMARQGEYRPRAGVVAGVGVDKVGEHTSQGVSDEAHEVGNPLARLQGGFVAAWELDVWQRMRTAAKAANLRYLASVEGRNFVVTEVVAEIASSYYEMLAIDGQLDVLRRNIEIQQSALEVVRLQKEAARATELAVQRFVAEVQKNQSRQFALLQKRVEAENRINVLLGRYPQAVRPSGEAFRAPLRAAAAGIPAQLLDNRPDVRQAALDLAAAKLDVTVARTAFFPALSIEAGAGYESFNAKHLLATPGSMVFNLAGNLVAPLINRRGLEAQYTMATARQLAAVYNYERTLLQAFTEVVNQLAMIANLEKGYDLQARQVDTLTQSIEISNVLFNAARADYGEVLLTRRDALEAQMELIETRNQQMQARVRLYRALGGGWR
ncbi:MAG: TolC family protein [Vicinamibacterales bacterium]